MPRKRTEEAGDQAADKATPDEILSEIDRRIDAAELTEPEKQAARERAQAHVAKLRKDKAVDEYFARAVKEAERAYEPADQIVDIVIELPEYAPWLMVDGIQYFHGVTYEVPARMAASMNENMWHAWQHQNEIDGRPRFGDRMRKPLHLQISPTNPQGRVTTRAMRA